MSVSTETGALHFDESPGMGREPAFSGSRRPQRGPSELPVMVVLVRIYPYLHVLYIYTHVYIHIYIYVCTHIYIYDVIAARGRRADVNLGRREAEEDAADLQRGGQVGGGDFAVVDGCRRADRHL